MDPMQAAQQIQALLANIIELTHSNENLERLLSPRMSSDNELLKIKMKRSSIQGLRETIMKKGQIAMPIGEQGC